MDPSPTDNHPHPTDSDPYAPDTNPSRFEHTYRTLQAEHRSLQHDMNVLHADIRMRMYLLNIVPKGYAEPARADVEEWIRVLKKGCSV